MKKASIIPAIVYCFLVWTCTESKSTEPDSAAGLTVGDSKAYPPIDGGTKKESGTTATQDANDGGAIPTDAHVNLDGSAEVGVDSGANGSDAADGTVPSDSDTSETDASFVIEPGNPGPADIVVTVRSNTNRRPISPLIYGINGIRHPATSLQTLARSGGNRMTAYNWENNASNAGSDWQFQNDNFLSDSSIPGKAVTDLIDEATAYGAASLVTIPIVDYVAADKNGGGDVRNSGANYLDTRFKKNMADKGSALSLTPDAYDGFVYQDEFVNFLKNGWGGSQILFSLDNEPDLWSSTHAEVHPEPVTYTELWERNYRFAKAIKRVWPEAEVTGFVSYGFNGYINLQNANDANGRDFIEWYLTQAREAEEAEGQRLIDYLDLHWYPEARGGGVRITEADNSDAVVEARVQAPRSLWDRSYRETSWISDDFLQGPIDLLHGLFDKIDAIYPGTKLAFTEWNYGGGDHISGAIATADVLGIFGREGVALAAYWPLGENEAFAEQAFGMYVTYFGEISIQASSTDVASVTAYGSIRSRDPERVVVVLINKAQTEKRVALGIAYPNPLSIAHIYTRISARSNSDPGADIAASAPNAFLIPLPAQSVSVVVSHRGDSSSLQPVSAFPAAS